MDISGQRESHRFLSISLLSHPEDLALKQDQPLKTSLKTSLKIIPPSLPSHR